MTDLIPPELSESEIVPYESGPPPGERILVLSPHPDDETFGCGGSLRILIQSGKAVRVVFLTKGEKADPAGKDAEAYASLREKEAGEAMKVLGIEQYAFLKFPDRELNSRSREAFAALRSICEEFRPDMIYSPSPVELHPDHRATALLALQMMQDLALRVAFYELITPVRPNRIVDISSVFRVKKKAIRKYKSQLKLLDYYELFRALSTYRTFTLVGLSRYAEVFWIVERPDRTAMIQWLSYQNMLGGPA